MNSMKVFAYRQLTVLLLSTISIDSFGQESLYEYYDLDSLKIEREVEAKLSDEIIEFEIQSLKDPWKGSGWLDSQGGKLELKFHLDKFKVKERARLAEEQVSEKEGISGMAYTTYVRIAFENRDWTRLLKQYNKKLMSILNEKGGGIFQQEVLAWEEYHRLRSMLIHGDFEGHSGGGGNGIVLEAPMAINTLLENRLDLVFLGYSYGMDCREFGGGFEYGNWRDY
jgi:hypothetical protein